MSIQNKINELTNRRATIEQGAGDAAPARVRVNKLLDEASFVEVGAFVKPRSTNFNLVSKDAPADGVVTGYGTINGRLVYVYSQDETVLGGALGEMHAKKISTIYDMALKMGAPVIALLDSAGVRLQESTDALEGFGDIFFKQSTASGVIPQISAVLGTCGGGATLLPSLSDITLMSSANGKLFVNSPNALAGADEDAGELTSAAFHAETTGIVDIVCDTDDDCLAAIRNLIDLLPSNNQEEAPMVEPHDDINRISESLDQVIGEGLDGRALISEIADDKTIVELRAGYATDVVTAIAHLGGFSVGMIANQTTSGDGRLTAAGMEKIADFVNLLDSFDIPVINFVDTTGFAATLAEEKAGLSKTAAKMTSAFANATTAKVAVIVNRAYGTAYVASNSKHIGADFVYAWPTAKILTMDAASAVKIMYTDEIAAGTLDAAGIAEKTAQYEAEQGDPFTAASRGYIDDIIEPAATRKRLVAVLEMLYSKYVTQPAKKHSTI